MSNNAAKWPVFPRAEIPAVPVLSIASFGRDGKARLPTLFDSQETMFLTSGRMAISACLEDIGVTDDDVVLVPAYNCRVMIDPIESTGARPEYFRIRADLSPDLRDVEDRIDKRTKAIIVVHYFGFAQDLTKIREMCAKYKLALIQDCAHMLFAPFVAPENSRVRDYAIASLMKFFPVYDGGCLVATTCRAEPDVRSGGFGFEVKSLVSTLERAASYGRLRPFSWFITPVLWALSRTRSAIKNRLKGGRSNTLGPDSSDGGFGFDSRWRNVRMSSVSRLLLNSVSSSRIIEKRRANYSFLVEELSRLEGIRPIRRELPNEVVPYVVPLYADNPDNVFTALMNQGMPLFRWEDVPIGVCDLTTEYSRHIIQVPCHQELRPAELLWIVSKFKDVLCSEGASPQ